MGISRHGRTVRLDLADPTIREWDCTVVHVDRERGIVLDRSAFYPGGGGQPPDHGVLLWEGVQTRIVGTSKGDDLYLVPADGDPAPPVGTTVTGAVEDARVSWSHRWAHVGHCRCTTRAVLPRRYCQWRAQVRLCRHSAQVAPWSQLGHASQARRVISAKGSSSIGTTASLVHDSCSQQPLIYIHLLRVEV
jgi:hypothetical protein